MRFETRLGREDTIMKRAWSLLLVLALILAFAAIPEAVDSPDNPLPPPDIEEIIEEVQTKYRLTIYYIYQDGSTAAPTYTEQLDAGTEYNVVSPTIPGYTPTMEVVSGVMPARDVEYTVIYIPAGSPDDPDIRFYNLEDYDIPLGLGTLYMNIGVCAD